MNTTGAGSMTERVRSYLDARDGEVLELTRELIRTPSPNPPGDERAVADLVTERLRALGIDEITRVGAEETRPNLLARVRGVAPGPTLVLSGHLDTKPAGDMDAWETDPWDPVLRDGDLVGLGSGDMKAAIAGMVYAAAALKQAQEADAAGGGFAGELLLVFTADEEAGAQLGSKWLADNGHLQADAAVIGEPSGITSEWQSVHLVSRGAALFKIAVAGTQMHSSISDRLPGVNATVKMARLIDRMDREFKSYLTYDEHPLCPTGPTVNVGVMVEGGVFYGVYPGNAEFACDVRTLPGMSEEMMKADIGRFLADAMADDPELRAELRWHLMVPPSRSTRTIRWWPRWSRRPPRCWGASPPSTPSRAPPTRPTSSSPPRSPPWPPSVPGCCRGPTAPTSTWPLTEPRCRPASTPWPRCGTSARSAAVAHDHPGRPAEWGPLMNIPVGSQSKSRS